MELFPYLKAMVDQNASDLFLSAGTPPNYKIQGVTVPLQMAPLKPTDVAALAASVMSEKQTATFEASQK